MKGAAAAVFHLPCHYLRDLVELVRTIVDHGAHLDLDHYESNGSRFVHDAWFGSATDDGHVCPYDKCPG